MTIPVDAFTRIRSRAAAVIARFGGPVLFFSDEVAAHQLSDGTWVEASDGIRFDGVGIQTKGDANEMLGIGALATMNLTNPIMILVAAQSPTTGLKLAGVPVPKLHMRWPYDPESPDDGTTYTITKVAEVAPSGKAIYYVVVGDV